jgi:hypothetical protein
LHQLPALQVAGLQANTHWPFDPQCPPVPQLAFDVHRNLQRPSYESQISLPGHRVATQSVASVTHCELVALHACPAPQSKFVVQPDVQESVC